MQEHPKQDKNRKKCKKRCIFVALLGGIVLAILLFLLINISMVPLSTSKYCGTNCHEMQTAYESWKLTAHAVNARGLTSGCVNCHLPPEDQYFKHLTAKGMAGAKDLYMHHFGPEYDSEKLREKVLEEFEDSRCIHCHENLLTKPSSEMAKDAHLESLQPSDPDDTIRCVECHEDAGHIR